jgi:hypothetical protein
LILRFLGKILIFGGFSIKEIKEYTLQFVFHNL